MTTYSHPQPPRETPQALRNAFADLRRHNAYAARVAQLLDARRERQIDRVVQTQHTQRTHQAR